MHRLLLTSVAFGTIVGIAFGQPGQSRGGFGVPKSGTMLPAVSAFNDKGETFSTRDLKGSYSVLVFGCLT
ncbi:MAG: hypothetical protein O3A00_23140 [Planctomycetota bacterium]|nr:hypothetical protein [Planctomycetota bacterium]